MKLMHFSDRRVKKVHSTPQSGRRPNHPLGKPRGFWLSVEDDPEEGWKAWCKSEGFQVSHLAYEHRIELKPSANILYLRTALQLREFTKQYGSPDTIGGLKRIFPNDPEYQFVYDIKWDEVAKKYQGIIIAPYIYELRLDSAHTWYYGWDCASGCIWDATAIESIQLVRVDEDAKRHIEKSFDETMKDFRRTAEKLGINVPEITE